MKFKRINTEEEFKDKLFKKYLLHIQRIKGKISYGEYLHSYSIYTLFDTNNKIIHQTSTWIEKNISNYKKFLKHYNISIEDVIISKPRIIYTKKFQKKNQQQLRILKIDEKDVIYGKLKNQNEL